MVSAVQGETSFRNYAARNAGTELVMLHRIYAYLVFAPTFLWNALLGRLLKVRNWWDRVDEHLIVGALPLKSDVPRLYEQGVRAVVNTCEEYPGPLEAYRRFGIQQLRVPTVDFTHPSLEDVRAAVEFIQAHVERGETVYVHCKAGRARSATIALCWMVAARGFSPRQALQRLLAARPHVNPHLTRRPVVQQFCREFDQEKSTAPESQDSKQAQNPKSP